MAKSDLLAASDGCTFWCDGHLCDRTNNHCDQCMCKCGHRWTREPGVSDPHAGQTCGFRWRDELNALSGSEHQCAEPVHPNFTDEHRCRCAATRPGVVVLGAAVGREA
jgi:hypothetical protein